MWERRLFALCDAGDAFTFSCDRNSGFSSLWILTEWWDGRLISVYSVTLEVKVCSLMSVVCFYEPVSLKVAKCGVPELQNMNERSSKFAQIVSVSLACL